MFGFDVTRPEASLFVGATQIPWDNKTRILQMSASYYGAFLLDCHHQLWELEPPKDGTESGFKPLTNLPQIQQVNTSASGFTALLDIEGRIWLNQSFKEKNLDFSSKISGWISSLVSPKPSLCDGFRLYEGNMPPITFLSVSTCYILCGSENGEYFSLNSTSHWAKRRNKIIYPSSHMSC